MDLSTLYVGQGALAIARHGGEAIAIDSLFPAEDEHGRRVEYSVARLMYKHVMPGMILTSFDDDHCCVDGIDMILSKFEPDWLMYPKYYKETECATAAFNVITKHERKRQNTSRPLRRLWIRLDQLESRILPGLSSRFQFETFSPHMDDMDSSNNSGIVIKLAGHGPGGFSYLVTGDTENARWEQINRIFRHLLKSDVMAAAHHGSKTGASAETLLLVEPDTILISAGVDSQYGHPDPQAVAAFQRVAKHVHATNIEGGVSLFTKMNGTEFETKLFQ
jgi:beta-lactamase superfamily II metal-dependent hydrolase